MRPCDSVSGNTLHAVCPSLELEDRVRALAFHREHDLLHAARLVLARRKGLCLEAAALGVAGQHPVQVSRPERGFVTSDALAHLQDHVLLVRRIRLDERELQLLLEPGQLGLELGRHRRELRIVPGRLEIGLGLPPRVGELLRAFQLLEPAARLGGLAVVVVDGGIGHPLLRLRVGALQVVDEVLDRGHGLIVALAVERGQAEA